MWWLLLFVGINLFYTWRYAGLNIDPDFALFNMAGQVGSWYGKDFVDCKSPLVHFWFWLLSKVWPSVYGVRFLHHFITGVPGIIYTLITGDIWGGLAFIVMIHSGFLYAFHGNVGDIPAGLILIALAVGNPWIAVGLFCLAVLYEPKLIVAFLPWVALYGFWWQAGAALGLGLVAALAIWYFKHPWWEILMEANIIIPKRMAKRRKGVYRWMPQFTAMAVLYLGAWVVASTFDGVDLFYFIPALIYFLFNFLGSVVRPNHLLPLVGFISASGIPPALVVGLSVVDFAAAGFYFGDIWFRFYPGLRDVIQASKQAGEYLKDRDGTLWVSSMFSEIYIWAKKPILYGMTEQIEISQVANERRKIVRTRLANNPPRYIVEEPGYGLGFDKAGYKPIAKNDYFIVYELRTKNDSPF
jgi:hypothetical protein